MPRVRMYADAKQKAAAYRLRRKAKSDAEKALSEQNQTIKGASLFGEVFGYEKPKCEISEHGGRIFKVLVISFPTALHHLEELEKGLLALDDARRKGYREVNREEVRRGGDLLVRYTLSKRKR